MDIVERLRREEDALDNEAADEIERLREALSFYANKQNYIEVKNSTVFVPIITVDFKPEIDNGRTARAALQQEESE